MQRVNAVIVSLLLLFSSPVYAAPQKVTVAHHGKGQWEVLVNNTPYFIKGVIYNFTVVGDDPNVENLRDWNILDLNGNGKNDLAYDVWVDKNLNNIQDPDEPAVGDWQLLKDMGTNTIRIYQMPSDDERIRAYYQSKGAKLTFGHPPNKEIYRDLYARYGIMTAVGHFFGEWGIGSGALGSSGTDYTNPQQRQHLLDGIRVMVEEHKDEPYTLMWIIGNENFNHSDFDNAETEVEAFLTLVNEAAKLIHQLDPNHPVAFCNWHTDHMSDIARLAPEIDIFGMNTYSQGFDEQYAKVRDSFDRPVLLTEYGTYAAREDKLSFDIQKNYHQVSWRSIWENRYGGKKVGNSIGAMVFQWFTIDP
jgi:beta-glucuronidase